MSNDVTIELPISEESVINSNSLYHHLLSYISDICKYTRDNDEPFCRYLDINFLKRIQKAILRSTYNFNAEEHVSKYNDNMSIKTNSTINIEDNHAQIADSNDQNETIQFTSSLPPIDNRRQDTRIRYAFEK